MNATTTRRRFLRALALATPALAVAPQLKAADRGRSFSFVLLGDLHFDRPGHHDMDWLHRHKPDDVRQVENYCRITRDLTPRLLAAVRASLARANPPDSARAAFVLQVGDLVEGLCGSAELAARQNREAIEFIEQAGLGVPFLFTKGNHDVTGDGATEAFAKIFHAFLTEQRRRLEPQAAPLASANYSVRHGHALFCCFDAYDRTSLDWLEAALAKRTEEHCFVVIHPPVVPYGARATWHLYGGAKDKARREKLLELLGAQRAFVLGGHIHKYSALVREAGRGRFAQLAVSSIVSAAEVKPKDLLEGVKDYTGDQVRVEPNHSPGTEKERRAVYDAERPFVRAFQYADLPGHAVVTVDGARVTARVFSGVSRELWRTVDLSGLIGS
jgi:UDP-2,3-diacylglucosamine pyrophosphatase LpxH